MSRDPREERAAARAALAALRAAFLAEAPADLAEAYRDAAFYSRAVPGWCYVPAYDLALRVPRFGPPEWRPGFGEIAAAARLARAA